MPEHAQPAGDGLHASGLPPAAIPGMPPLILRTLAAAAGLKRHTFFTRLSHDHIVFAVRRQLYRLGLAFVIMPIRLETNKGTPRALLQ